MGNARATGADIITAMIDNLHTHLEPIYYTAQAPSLYHVYLHQSDFTRLKGIFPQIINEAKQALDEEMKKLNRKGVVSSLRESFQKQLPASIQNRLAGKPGIVYQVPKEGWQIAFYLDADGELAQGDVQILSELSAPPEIEYGEGNATMTVRTIKRAEQPPKSEQAQSIEILKPPSKKSAKPKQAESAQVYQQTLTPQQPSQAHSAQPTLVAPPEKIYAVIRYKDNNGDQIFRMTKSPIIIGRGGKDQNVDLELKADARLSREHLHIIFNDETDRFYIKDVSTYGVTVNGEKIPGKSDIARTDTPPYIMLPARSRIVLADVMMIEFEAMEDARKAK